MEDNFAVFLILVVFLVALVATAIVLLIINLRQKKIRVSLSLYDTTNVKFGENFEISIESVNYKILYGYHFFQIKDVNNESARGFTITKITEGCCGIETFVPYTKYDKTFRIPSDSSLNLNIYYSINCTYSENETATSCAAKKMKSLKSVFLNKKCQKKKAEKFIEKVSISPAEKTIVKFGDNLEFSVEKVDCEKKDGYYYFQIKDTKGSFKFTKITENYGSFETFVPYTKHNQTFHLSRISTFDLTFHITIDLPCAKYDNERVSIEIPLINVSCPISAIPSPPSDSPIWYKIGTNDRFADVFFITFDGTKIPSHRNILAEFSPIFAKIFKEKLETPVEINVEDIEADTVKSGLNFLYGKNDAINGKEMAVFKFADKYDIRKLIEACCVRLETLVDPSNVCEYVQIAYEHNVQSFKENCLKILVENRKEIGASKIASLSQNILSDALSF